MFEVLSDVDRELVRQYFGLAGGEVPASQAELCQRFGLTRWQLSTRLKQAVARLLDPTAVQLDPAERRRSRSLKIAEARRRHSRPAAAALQALTPEVFESLADLERELVCRYHGLGDERAWSQQELSQRYQMPVARVGRVVDAAVRQLLGVHAVPMIGRECAVCGAPFTVESRTVRRRTCGVPDCHRELRRRAGRASAAARRARALP